MGSLKNATFFKVPNKNTDKLMDIKKDLFLKALLIVLIIIKKLTNDRFIKVLKNF